MDKRGGAKVWEQVKTEDDYKAQTMAIDGVEVHYEYYRGKHAKEEPVIVLLHGLVSSSYSFRYLMPLIGKKYPVLAIDLPGFGKSEKSKTFIYSFESYAKLIFRLLQMMQVKNVIAVGHSMGGQVALYMAKNYPDHVKKLVLLSSSGYLKRVKKHYLYASYLPFSSRVLRWWFQKRDYKDALLHVVYNKNAVDDYAVLEYTKPFQDEGFYDALIRLMRHREGDLTAEQLKEIKQPALLFWGKEDEIVPLRIGKKLDHDLPQSELVVYEQTGHLVPEERPQEVAQKMLEFLEDQ